MLISTVPESLAVLPDFDGEVEFRFDEVVSEGSTPNFGLGSGDLEKLVILSPSLAVPSVHWRRSRITVRPRDGWQPNTVYRVELLPGIIDLSSNRARNGGVVTFSTGAPLPTRMLRGVVVDWNTRRPHPRALIEAVLLPDSLPYRMMADSAGRFVLGPLPAGNYFVYGVVDQNNDFRRAPREPFDFIPLGAAGDSVGELWAFRHDTVAARLTSVAPHDSLSLLLSFSQSLNPYQRLLADSVEVRLLPDSVAVPVLRTLPKEEFDTTYRTRPPVDTTAAGRARADSLRADSLRRARADSLRADSLARARALIEAQVPGTPRRRPGVTDTTATRQFTSRPALFDKLYVRLRDRLRPGATYVVIVHGIENLSRIAGTTRGAVKIPEERPPPDTTKAKPDTIPRLRESPR